MAVSILHITDIHFAVNRHTAVMAAIQQEFKSDLRYLIRKLAHPIGVIAFTGDLALSGDIDQYVIAEEFFQLLGNLLLEETGSVPTVFAVPGNHDVNRTDLGLAALPKLVESLWEDVASDFWGADGDGLRQRVRDGFAAYSAWWQSPGLPTNSASIDGLMIGDHAATLKVGQSSIGLLGLNTAVRHLSDRAKPGGLSVADTQISKACGGDIVRWANQHQLCVLLTHHPSSWLDEKSQLLLGELLFTPQSPVRIHLSGHLHSASAGVGDHLATSEYQRLQGRSLFGTESLPGGEMRSHGYQVVELNDDGAFRLWPRAATRTAGGAWNLGPDTKMGLPKGSECTPWRPLGGQLTAAAVTARHSQPPDHPHAKPFIGEKGVTDREIQAIQDRLLRDVATGTVRLVLGDDLSSTNAPTSPVDRSSGVCLLRTTLQRIALGVFASEGAEAAAGSPTINELLRVAHRVDGRGTRAAVSEAAADLSETWASTRRMILSAPWPTIVDLWISDDLARQGDLAPLKRSIVTASDDFSLDDRLILLKMNGSANEPARVTFEPPATSSQSSNRRMWFQRLSIDFVRSPVLYLAESVDQLRMWEYIELRGTEACSLPGVPTAYLVCPSLTPVQEATLALYKVLWIRSAVEGFANGLLKSSRSEIADGSERLRVRIGGSDTSHSSLQNVRDLRERAGEGGPDVLLGREPSWGDVVHGFTLRFSAVDVIKERLSIAKSKIVLLHGTAGCGKSTALMHLALELDAEGLTVLWIDRSTELRVGQILERVKYSSPDYVIVDNVDIYGVFGAKATHVLDAVSRTATVVAAVRTNQLSRLDAADELPQIRLPDLAQADIWSILDALELHGLLGKLRGMAIADRYQTLTSESGRQLLVALMQATKGRRFSEILEDEYNELDSLQQFTYVLACIVSALNEVGISDRELEMAAGGYGVAARKATDSLLKSRLLVAHADGLLSPRHRVIGEAVLAAVQRRGELADAILPLLQVLTVSAKATKDTSRRDRRLMVRLINHDQLAKFGLDLLEARALYKAVQGDLYDDFHFWLQRGTYELERGSLEYALNYLEQARLVEGGHDDPYVLTEFSLARLRTAMVTKDRASAVGLAEEALADLGRIIRIQGVKSPHTVVVLATAGLDWIEQADISGADRVRYAKEMRRLLTIVQAVSEESEYAGRTLKAASKRLGRILDVA